MLRIRCGWVWLSTTIGMNIAVAQSESPVVGISPTLFFSTESGRCLEVSTALPQRGAPILQAPCHQGPTQQWRIESLEGEARIVSVYSNQCLAIQEGSIKPGAFVVQTACAGRLLNGRWRFTPMRGGVQIVASHSKLCLNVEGNPKTNGAYLTQWPCTGSDKEIFYLKQNGPNDSLPGPLMPELIPRAREIEVPLITKP